MSGREQTFSLPKSVLYLAIGVNLIFVAVALGGIAFEAIFGPQEWQKIVHFVVFGLPFSVGLAILLGRKSDWFNQTFSGQRGKRLTYILIGIYVAIRVAEWAVMRT